MSDTDDTEWSADTESFSAFGNYWDTQMLNCKKIILPPNS